VLDKPAISDAEYDRLVNELRRRDNAHSSLDDERRNFTLHHAKAVQATKPRWVIAENAPSARNLVHLRKKDLIPAAP
jgi:site-specific DNA-cytosine methylase